MMIKITEHCSMGCSHCMNDATPCNRHMALETFRDALDYVIENAFGMCLITGGEPTEHPDFMLFLEEALEDSKITQVTVTTNGAWMQTHYNYVKLVAGVYGEHRCFWQVTSDERYYPTPIDLNEPVFSLPSVIICDHIEKIYPQGRAKTNNLPYSTKASKCFNVRAITRQLYDMYSRSGRKLTIKDICQTMMAHGYFCTPHIGIHGEIRLGESDLCPNCGDIYDNQTSLISSILDFKCKQCEFVNKNLPDMHLRLIGEK